MSEYFKIDHVATRSEYWAVVLINFFATFVLAVLGGALIASAETALVFFGGVILVATIIGSVWLTIATTIRRCKDAGVNPWWTLGTIVPYVSIVVIIVLGCLPTDVTEK
jgi:uncharacterized membrane protein YhaH (DUF805 family)